jgi:hypothetical protein
MLPILLQSSTLEQQLDPNPNRKQRGKGWEEEEVVEGVGEVAFLVQFPLVQVPPAQTQPLIASDLEARLGRRD